MSIPEGCSDKSYVLKELVEDEYGLSFQNVSNELKTDKDFVKQVVIKFLYFNY